MWDDFTHHGAIQSGRFGPELGLLSVWSFSPCPHRSPPGSRLEAYNNSTASRKCSFMMIIKLIMYKLILLIDPINNGHYSCPAALMCVFCVSSQWTATSVLRERTAWEEDRQPNLQHPLQETSQPLDISQSSECSFHHPVKSHQLWWDP